MNSSPESIQQKTASTEPAFLTVVGMEVHAQLLTRTKMFCRCSTDYQGAPPNTHTCPVCLGLPGAMPVINQAAVEATIKTGVALNCEIEGQAVFARKNYHYPDLPKGYQISQYELPLCRNGWIEIPLGDDRSKRIRIHRAHLEEDTGKNTHSDDATLVDLNRAGMPLLEIVTEADISSPEEAYAFLTELRRILRYLGVNSGDMEKGALRCEPNISVRTAEQAARAEFGTKVEVKNLNSFRAVRSAIAYETLRQSAVIRDGGVVEQVNMGWDENSGRTVLQRSKESSEDYRYFPEPDLPPLSINAASVEQIRGQLPMLPAERRQHYVQAFGLRPIDAETLTEERAVADFFEATVDAYGSGEEHAQRVANWITGELFRLIYAASDGQDLRQIEEIALTPQQLAALLALIDKGAINVKIGRRVLGMMAESGDEPAEIVAREGWAVVRDTGVIDEAIAQVLAAHPEEVGRYRSGEEKLFGFFIGGVMRRTRGQGDADTVRLRLREALSTDP